MLATTAYFALRRSRYLAPAASATAALLVVDAWFDCMTTPSAERWQSILLCAFIELPLAGVCLWLSYHTLQIAERRVILLQRRHWAEWAPRVRGPWSRHQRGHAVGAGQRK